MDTTAYLPTESAKYLHLLKLWTLYKQQDAYLNFFAPLHSCYDITTTGTIKTIITTALLLNICASQLAYLCGIL